MLIARATIRDYLNHIRAVFCTLCSKGIGKSRTNCANRPIDFRWILAKRNGRDLGVYSFISHGESTPSTTNSGSPISAFLEPLSTSSAFRIGNACQVFCGT